MEISSLYKIFVQEKRVTTDSRVNQDGGIFFALKGENFDGNTFASIAIENGANYAIIDNASFKIDERFIVVDDVLQCLQKLAYFHRQQFKFPVIGITGTNGKTTTKELVNAVLKSKFKTFCTKGNFNNHIGVPLTLLSIPTDAEFAIIEMGANHPHEISELCTIADPDFGIISSIGKAHLEGFGSFENIINTKKELYDHVAAKKGTLFVNADDTLLTSISSGCNCIFYGSLASNFCSGKFVESTPFVTIQLNDSESKIDIYSNLIGSYNTSNILAAACVGKYFGIPTPAIARSIHEFEPENNRSQLKKTTKNTLLLDAYNANPSSMEASVSNFKIMKAEHKIAILGEMRELGDVARMEHYKLYDQVIAAGFEHIYIVGNWHLCPINKNVSSFENTNALIEHIKSNPIESKTILIKGSRGNKLESVVEYL